MMTKIVANVVIELKLKAGTNGKYFPMMVVTKDGSEVESALSLTGFKYKDDAQKVLDKTLEILNLILVDEEGSDV